MKARLVTFVAILICGSTALPAQTGSGEGKPYEPEKVEVHADAPRRSPWFFGGAAGLSFGTVDFIELAPLIGYRINRRVSIGAEILFRYRNDSRYFEDVATTDYGGIVFTQVGIAKGFFGEVDVEYLSYEFVYSNLSVDRFGETSVFVGGGFSRPMGKRAAFYVAALYNVTWSASDFPSPYTDPLVLRVGVTIGF